MEQAYKYMVVTRCFTFNHASYIVDAMNGFTMQETTFPVITLIVDDASTDGEPEVIKQYLTDHFQTPYRIEENEDYNLICTNHNTNPNCTFVVFLLKYNHHSIKKPKMPYLSEWRDNAKYIAICEGDDYWIDSSKLQKQVDFLENHPDYSMCFHNAIEHWENKLKKDSLFSQIKDKDYSGIDIFSHWIVPTASVVIKSEVFHSELLKKVRAAKLSRGDTPLFCTAAALGLVRGCSYAFSVYRRNEGSFMFQPKTINRIQTYLYHLRMFPILFGQEYKIAACKQIGYCLADQVWNSIRKCRWKDAKMYLSLQGKEEKAFVRISILTYPIRAFQHKYLSRITTRVKVNTVW